MPPRVPSGLPDAALSHRICADQIVPYPPGIMHEGYQPCVRVLKSAEAHGLHRIG